jgi:hypothetical protein
VPDAALETFTLTLVTHRPLLLSLRDMPDFSQEIGIF